MKQAALTAFVVGLVFGPAQPAEAAAFRVTPIRVTFNAATNSSLLTLSNDSDTELRFQISASAWQQEPLTGEMKLAPTDDIIFFPALLALKPGEERKVRVGTSKKPAATEQTYRIFFEELPPVERPNAEGAQVRIITKMGIPIFIEPAKRSAAGDVGDIAVDSGKLSFTVRNRGNVHFITQSIRVVGLDSAGKNVFEKQREGWYLLAGDTRQYDLDFSAEECSGVKKFRVEVQTDLSTKPENAVLAAEVTVPPGACSGQVLTQSSRK